jgi:hypothetical protein
MRQVITPVERARFEAVLEYTVHCWYCNDHGWVVSVTDGMSPRLCRICGHRVAEAFERHLITTRGSQ